MGWRLANSLKVLRAEVNALAPGRNKKYDGDIGDEKHQKLVSDHNPNKKGVVCALDITHDPKHGADMGVISERIRNSKHPALKYIIYNYRIWSPGQAIWYQYEGDNPHTGHCHISVHGDYDNDRPWGIGKPGAPEAPEKPVEIIYRLTSPYMRGEEVKRIQVALGVTADGIYGPRTRSAVIIFQRKHGLKADGIVGPETRKALGVT